MFDERNRIKEHLGLSKTESEIVLLLSLHEYVTYKEFTRMLFIDPSHLRSQIVKIRQKGIDIYNIHGQGYILSPVDRVKVKEAASRP